MLWDKANSPEIRFLQTVLEFRFGEDLVELLRISLQEP